MSDRWKWWSVTGREFETVEGGMANKNTVNVEKIFPPAGSTAALGV